MRSFIGASLALAATTLAHSNRKSLGFGPELPHSQFVTNVPHLPSFVPFRNAREVARAHLANILASPESPSPSEGRDFVIRDDSYTDDNTGVSHIYIRQLVNGIEVADGDINMNILGGKVLSYGDSFYRGSAPTELKNSAPVEDMHFEACSRAAASLQEHSGQVVMGGGEVAHDPSLALTCNSFEAVVKGRERSYAQDQLSDPREAVLHFMIAAHPSPQEAHAIHDAMEKHLCCEIDSTFEQSFTGTHESRIEVLHRVPGTINPVKAKLVYVQSPVQGEKTTALTLAWKLEVEMQDNWYEAYMDAMSPSRIHTVIDWASDSPIPKPPTDAVEPSYRIWEWGINDPSEGKRTLVSEQYDKIASPLGWHAIPANKDPSFKGRSSSNEIRNFTTTWGNNVFAHENWEGANNWIDNYRPSGGEELVFDFKYGPKGKDGESVKPKDYANLSITQLFYTSNLVHDLYYRYGFDEKAGNFQQYNFGKGGKDGDGVIANAQDGSGYNNANFMTPPDGQNGRCRMYVWNTATPYRDGDLEAGIVIHELTHGLSTRITGGPANSGCLGWGESGGMGEGWGDFMATTIRANSTYADYPMGAWAANNDNGIRHYPYSTNSTINPSTYKTLDSPGYWGVHAIGEVWSQILWFVEQKLIAKHGYADSLFPPAPAEDGSIPLGDFYVKSKTGALVPKHGNSLLIQLVIDGMKLQPCRPSFFDARDAIIQADAILTGGENACELWKGFSEKGLGVDAEIVGSTPWGGGVRSNGYEFPPTACNQKQ